MAEVIGIIAGLIGISQAGVATSKTLFSLGQSLVKAKEQINDLAQELSNISSAFESLAQVLESSDGLLKPALLDTTQAILDDCRRIFAEIEENVKIVERHALKARDRAQWPFKKAKLKQLKSRLESAKATLGLMVNILNLSTGIKFLQQQTRPPPEIVKETKEMFASSTESVIKVQLAFDEAEEYEKQLAKVENHKHPRTIKASSSRNKQIPTTLIKIRPIIELALDLPGFVELSVVPVNDSRDLRVPSRGKAREEQDHSIIRTQQIERQAPLIVKELCVSWTNVDQALSDTSHDILMLEQEGDKGLELPACGIISGRLSNEANRCEGLISVALPAQVEVEAREAEPRGVSSLELPRIPSMANPTPRPKSLGFSVRGGSGDEPPACVTSYSSSMRPSLFHNRVWQETTFAGAVAQDNTATRPETLRHDPGGDDPDTIPFNIEDGIVRVEDLRKEIARRDEDKTRAGDLSRVEIWHDGSLLENDEITARSLGLKHGSTVFVNYAASAPSNPEAKIERNRVRERTGASSAQFRDSEENGNRRTDDGPQVSHKLAANVNHEDVPSDSGDDLSIDARLPHDVLRLIPAHRRYNNNPLGFVLIPFKYHSIEYGDLTMAKVFSSVRAAFGMNLELYFRGVRLRGREDVSAKSEGLHSHSHVFCRTLSPFYSNPRFTSEQDLWTTMLFNAKVWGLSYVLDADTDINILPRFRSDLPTLTPALAWRIINEFLGDVFDGHLTRNSAELYMTTDVLPILFQLPAARPIGEEVRECEDLLYEHELLWLDLFRANQRELEDALCARNPRSPRDLRLSVVSRKPTKVFVEYAKAISSIVGRIIIKIECVPVGRTTRSRISIPSRW